MKTEEVNIRKIIEHEDTCSRSGKFLSAVINKSKTVPTIEPDEEPIQQDRINIQRKNHSLEFLNAFFDRAKAEKPKLRIAKKIPKLAADVDPGADEIDL